MLAFNAAMQNSSNRPQANDITYELVAQADGAAIHIDDHGKPVSVAGAHAKVIDTVTVGFLDSVLRLKTPRLAHVTVDVMPGPVERTIRERLTDDSTMNFGDRSIANLGSAWNRDVGAAIQTYPGKFAGTFAVMTGPRMMTSRRCGSPATSATTSTTVPAAWGSPCSAPGPSP